jgi:CheY-like chemotaxis protein
VVAADSAARGLVVIAERVPDVIVGDIGVPGEHGYAFIERVRRLDGGPLTPAIVLPATPATQAVNAP